MFDQNNMSLKDCILHITVNCLFCILPFNDNFREIIDGLLKFGILRDLRYTYKAMVYPI